MTTFPSLAAEKDTLRKEALARRGALPEVDRIEKSLSLCDFIDELPIPEGAIVAGFWPIRDEVDPRPLLDQLRQRGHALCLPVVAKPHLLFRSLVRGAEMEPAGFGTMAPGRDAAVLRPDVLLMPLAGFDAAGNRIGYGKGHYDTAIAALEADGPLACIGVAFATQEVDRVPAEAHDKPLDGILTEQGYRAFG
ncbi:MAG: 5-formyltetrahydrofolate cyclo-ligase [Roseibium sp.]|uniref:5-formyltetrahydrofolate cyclo-ligase n=1 Tax=Roseibium sp. TaxID=1936156 RepID=UPI001B2A15A6|nr:5-formyltetrahydrofolate cyclo-ligase [Roseibium sp.]MBO6509491.1 5-formyltetrahydrofolate cyclo-ligase [Roseibium sp.]MBO6892883.1 5-formyltetrahydrofolate cyclo-ligase [Roseibium sp.]MBO6927984.1 5-formyltetrahydrofolate cyclo-ligase [Roseibium sp.]